MRQSFWWWHSGFPWVWHIGRGAAEAREGFYDVFFPEPLEMEAEVPWVEEPLCSRCGHPFDGQTSGPFECGNCRGVRWRFDAARAHVRVNGAVRRAVHDFKYNRAFWRRRQLGGWLVEGFRRHFGEGASVRREHDALVPIPLHPDRERWRHFNQSEVLARWLAWHVGLPVWKALEREKDTPLQTRLNRARRMANMRSAFVLATGVQVRDTRLLLIDDVLTTGSTASECARVLKRAGARRVDVLTVARG